MPPRKKKFIDKKNAVTFHLVHRSQRDPLQADDEAPQHVLLPANQEQQNTPEARVEEQRTHGVYYDDDYDYMQHLKSKDEMYDVQPTEVIRFSVPSSNKDSSIQLPSQVFASEAESDVGLLNKAAPHTGPRLDWDPDIVAGLDEDFDFENPDNQLEDDFILQANEGELGALVDEDEAIEGRIPTYRSTKETVDDEDGSDDDGDYASDEADFSGDEDNVSDVGSLEQRSFSELETKTRFTNYSMSSSIIKRTEGLTLLDDRFEKLYEAYDDTEIGALDHEDIGGCVQADSQVLNSVLQEFEGQQKVIALKDVIEKANDVAVESDADSSEDGLVKVQVDEKPQAKWDCESILSTYSNLYNHPKKIEEPKKVKPIRVSNNTELPIEGLPQHGLTRKQVEEVAASSTKDLSCMYRPKDESTEERHARKQAVKAERKARREEKKANKEAFKEEKMKQQKEILNVQKNLSGIRIN